MRCTCRRSSGGRGSVCLENYAVTVLALKVGPTLSEKLNSTSHYRWLLTASNTLRHHRARSPHYKRLDKEQLKGETAQCATKTCINWPLLHKGRQRADTLSGFHGGKFLSGSLCANTGKVTRLMRAHRLFVHERAACRKRESRQWAERRHLEGTAGANIDRKKCSAYWKKKKTWLTDIEAQFQMCRLTC